MAAERETPPPADGPRLIDPEDVRIRDVEWLIEYRLRANTLNLIQGHGGTNKGTWCCHVAALATTGELDGCHGEPMMVLFASAEDERETVLQPRLIAAGANLRFVRYMDNVALPSDMRWVRETIRQVGARLMFVDPLVTHLESLDTWKDQQVKQALTPILELAQEETCTLCGVHHFTKDTSRGALLSGNGSGAFGNTARVVLAMVRDDEDADQRILEVVKSNGGPIGLTSLYRVNLVPVAGLDSEQVTVTDLGESAKSADEALANARKTENVPKAKLRQLILEALATGSKTREYLDTTAKDDLGVSRDQLYRYGLIPLRDEGLIRASKEGMDGGWRWQLAD